MTSRQIETHINTSTVMPSDRHQIKMIAIGEVKPATRNARTHSKRQIKEIADSISRFRWTFPILVDESWHIIAGHGRYEAAKLLGLAEVPVLEVTGLSGIEKRALALADNKIAEKAGWDRTLLAAELAELRIELPKIDLDISITGFETPEIDALFSDLSDAENYSAEDPVPAPHAEAVSRLGDLWLLGEHRLVCGDACEETSILQLMDGKQASMVIADPPFNVKIKATRPRKNQAPRVCACLRRNVC